MEYTPYIEVNQVLYAQPHCPYCGLVFEDRRFDNLDDLVDFMHEYYTTNKFVCVDCLSSKDKINNRKDEEKEDEYGGYELEGGFPFF